MEQDEDEALADAREAMASPDPAADGDATPTTGNPSPTVSPFRVTYPIGGTTQTKPPPEELDEARALGRDPRVAFGCALEWLVCGARQVLGDSSLASAPPGLLAPARAAGVTVEAVDDLGDKLKNEAAVL